MKKVKIIIATLILAVLAIGISVFAADAMDEKFRKPMHGLNLTEEQQTILTEKIMQDLDEMVESGDITQEQSDAISDKLEKGFFAHDRRPMHNRGFFGGRHNGWAEKFKEEQRAKLEAGEITQEEYDELVANIDEKGFEFGKGPEQPKEESEDSEGGERPFGGMRSGRMPRRHHFNRMPGRWGNK